MTFIPIYIPFWLDFNYTLLIICNFYNFIYIPFWLDFNLKKVQENGGDVTFTFHSG